MLIRVFILKLLGFVPVFEIRKFKLSSKRRMPGTLIGRDTSYRKARDVFRKHRLGEGDRVRLQLISILRTRELEENADARLREMWEEAHAMAGPRANLPGFVLPGVSRDLYEGAQAAVFAIDQGTADEGMRESLCSCLSAAREAGEDAMRGLPKSRRGNAPRRLQQTADSQMVLPEGSSSPPQGDGASDVDPDGLHETDVEGPFPPAGAVVEGSAGDIQHNCDHLGPMVIDDESGAYDTTCSICGEKPE